MSETNEKPRYWVKGLLITVAAVLIAGLCFLILVQIQQAKRDGETDFTGQLPSEPNKPAKDSSESGKGEATSGPGDGHAIDLKGQREPTEKELVREAIEYYLVRLRDIKATDPKDRLLNYNRLKAELRELLKNLPPDAVPLLAELLENETDSLLRRVLLLGLSDIGTEEASEVIRDYILEYAGNRKRGAEMRYAIRALGRSDTQTAYNSLVEFINSEDTDTGQYRPFFVKALGKHSQGYKAVPLFVDLLKTDPHYTTRNRSAQAIKNVAREDAEGGLPAVPSLQEQFRKEKVMYVKQTILGAIGQIGDPESIPFLREVGLTDKTLDVRLSAAAAASRIGGERGLKALREIYANEENKHVLLGALGKVPTRSTVSLLEGVALGGDSLQCRKDAVNSLGLIKEEYADESLRVIAEQAEEPSVAEAARKKLSARSGG